eukprot:8039764-Lingulodinium_polyedra.AAC.1
MDVRRQSLLPDVPAYSSCSMHARTPGDGNSAVAFPADAAETTTAHRRHVQRFILRSAPLRTENSEQWEWALKLEGNTVTCCPA